MKRTIVIVLAVLACQGCVDLNGSRTLPDGSKLQVNSRRAFWMSQDLRVRIGDGSTNTGFEFSLEAKTSRPDAEAIATVLKFASDAMGAAAKGAVQGAKP